MECNQLPRNKVRLYGIERGAILRGSRLPGSIDTLPLADLLESKVYAKVAFAPMSQRLRYLFMVWFSKERASTTIEAAA